MLEHPAVDAPTVTNNTATQRSPAIYHRQHDAGKNRNPSFTNHPVRFFNVVPIQPMFALSGEALRHKERRVHVCQWQEQQEGPVSVSDIINHMMNRNQRSFPPQAQETAHNRNRLDRSNVFCITTLLSKHACKWALKLPVHGWISANTRTDHISAQIQKKQIRNYIYMKKHCMAFK